MSLCLIDLQTTIRRALSRVCAGLEGKTHGPNDDTTAMRRIRVLKPLPLSCESMFQVSWPDFERLLREKADASVLADLSANCPTSAAVERLEMGLTRAVGMEEV